LSLARAGVRATLGPKRRIYYALVRSCAYAQRVSLYAKLRERAARDQPLVVGVIGTGKFGSMYAAQLPRTPGIHLLGAVDRAPERARANLARTGIEPESYMAESFEHALRERRTHVSDDWQALLDQPALEILIEASGDPIAAVEHALYAFERGKHVVMVTVEADAFVGPMLARRAARAGVVYSLAYGDQPAMICDLVDWARTAGFPVVAAGRGHKWRPEFAASTPDTVWAHYGLTPEQARLGGLNPKMFNSFLDGSKPAIECAATCNATGLTSPPGGLTFPPASIDALPTLMRPRAEGGVLQHKGQIEVVSSLEHDGTTIAHDIRFGVWVVFEGESEYIRRCFGEYGVHTDPSGRYACLYKRWHLIGLELGISIASVGLRREPTGVATGFIADAVTVAKRDLAAGERLDGEGGYTVVGRLMAGEASLARECLPLGLAHGARLITPCSAGALVRWRDVVLDETLPAVRLRRGLETERRVSLACQAEPESLDLRSR
jgi:predicted homoserine dehydrogenase-like protein